MVKLPEDEDTPEKVSEVVVRCSRRNCRARLEGSGSAPVPCQGLERWTGRSMPDLAAAGLRGPRRRRSCEPRRTDPLCREPEDAGFWHAWRRVPFGPSPVAELILAVKETFLSRNTPRKASTDSQRVDKIFRNMDRNKDAKLTYEEFKEGSKQDPTIVQVSSKLQSAGHTDSR
jgi:hypothetical protein